MRARTALTLSLSLSGLAWIVDGHAGRPCQPFVPPRMTDFRVCSHVRRTIVVRSVRRKTGVMRRRMG